MLERCGVLHLGLARAVPRERGARVRRSVRALAITETPAFQRAIEQQRARARADADAWFASIRACSCSARWLPSRRSSLFYLMTVFSLSWGTSALGFSRQEFLLLQMIGVLFFAPTIPLSAVIADRYGGRRDADRRRASATWCSACCWRRCSRRRTPPATVFLVARLRTEWIDVRPARCGDGRAVPDRRSLHGRIVDVQSRGHSRRLTCALHRHVPRCELRHCVCRLLPVAAAAVTLSRSVVDRPSRPPRGSSRATRAVRD